MKSIHEKSAAIKDFPHRHIYADHLGDGHGDNLLNRVALLPSHLSAVVLVPRPHLRAGLLLFLYFDIAQTIWTFWALFPPKNHPGKHCDRLKVKKMTMKRFA